MVIRAADTIALQHLTDTYKNLSASSITLAVPKTCNSVPVISSLHPHSPPQEGGFSLAPMAYITTKTLLGTAAAAQSAGVRTIPEWFEMVHGTGEQVYGVVLPWGVLDCSKQLTVQYAHEFMLFHQRFKKNKPVSPSAHKMSSDTIMTLLQVCTHFKLIPGPLSWRCADDV